MERDSLGNLAIDALKLKKKDHKEYFVCGGTNWIELAVKIDSNRLILTHCRYLEFIKA
jgi:hypothetical protein